jgi:hypothetical protein
MATRQLTVVERRSGVMSGLMSREPISLLLDYSGPHRRHSNPASGDKIRSKNVSGGFEEPGAGSLGVGRFAAPRDPNM